jgi:hypothetical protein
LPQLGFLGQQRVVCAGGGVLAEQVSQYACFRPLEQFERLVGGAEVEGELHRFGVGRRTDLRVVVGDRPHYTDIAGADLLTVVAEQQLEGVIAKRATSLYYPGKHT